jgi:hypothetical protein
MLNHPTWVYAFYIVAKLNENPPPWQRSAAKTPLGDVNDANSRSPGSPWAQTRTQSPHMPSDSKPGRGPLNLNDGSGSKLPLPRISPILSPPPPSSSGRGGRSVPSSYTKARRDLRGVTEKVHHWRKWLSRCCVAGRFVGTAEDSPN